MISAVIITFNEEKKIERCLRSLAGVADEIIVVDSFSTDQTEAICRKYQVRFIRHRFEGFIEQKNFAMEQAVHPFVLSLDADECLSDELKNSILTVKKDLRSDAYSMNRLNNFCGKWIRHSGWYPDRKIRLWNREKGKWGGMNPHDKVVMNNNSTVGFLRGDLLHYTADSIEQHKAQMDRFARIAAKELSEKWLRTSMSDDYNPPSGTGSSFPPEAKALATFIRRYIFQLGFLDGYYGYVICREAARYTFWKYDLAQRNLSSMMRGS